MPCCFPSAYRISQAEPEKLVEDGSVERSLNTHKVFEMASIVTGFLLALQLTECRTQRYNADPIPTERFFCGVFKVRGEMESRVLNTRC